MSERTLLAQMLWDLKEAGDGLSFSKMAARSGGLVAVSTLHGVMNGKTKELPPDTIDGLANILGISRAQVIAALKNEPLSAQESQDEDKERLWEMYSGMSQQTKKTAMEILAVLRRNHGIGGDISDSPNGPIRVASSLDSWEGEYRIPKKTEQEPDVPAKKKQA